MMIAGTDITTAVAISPPQSVWFAPSYAFSPMGSVYIIFSDVNDSAMINSCQMRMNV